MTFVLCAVSDKVMVPLLSKTEETEDVSSWTVVDGIDVTNNLEHRALSGFDERTVHLT